MIVETAFQGKAMEELLKELLGKEIADLPEEQRPWLPTIEPVTFSADASAEEIEQILRRYGLRFDTSPVPHLIGVDRYLGALA